MPATISCDEPILYGIDLSDPPGPGITINGRASPVNTGWYVTMDADSTLPALQGLVPTVTITGTDLTYTCAANVPYGQKGQVWANLFNAQGAVQCSSNKRDVNQRSRP